MLFSDVTCSWNKEGVSSSLLLLFALLTHQPLSFIFNSSSEPGFVEDDIKMIVLQAWMFHAWYYLTEINCCNSTYMSFHSSLYTQFVGVGLVEGTEGGVFCLHV